MYSPNSEEELIYLEDDSPQQRDYNLIEHVYQFESFSSSVEKNFETRLKDLEDYLNRLISSDDRFIFASKTPQNVPIIVEAKKRYKESASEVISNLRKDFQEGRRLQILPECYLRQSIESAKNELFLSYNRLMQNVKDSLGHNGQLYTNTVEESKTPEPVIKPKQKPGKTKFPKKARLVLESWYKAHSDDPFPSYSEKQRLAEETGITMKQVKCWFINVRRKRWNKDNEDHDFKLQIEKKFIQNARDLKNINNIY